MDTDTLTVSQVAEMLGVSAASVRRYADTLAPHLSEHARSRPRTFTGSDVDRLRVAAQVKASKVAPQATSRPSPDSLALSGDSLPADSLIASPDSPQPPQDELLSLMLSSHDRRIAAVERALMAQQRDQRRLDFITGMCAGLLLAGFLLWAAYLLATIGP